MRSIESKPFLDLKISLLAVTQRRQKVYNKDACYTLFAVNWFVSR